MGFVVKSNVDIHVVSLRAIRHSCDASSVQIMVHTACVSMSSLYWLVEVPLAIAEWLWIFFVLTNFSCPYF